MPIGDFIAETVFQAVGEGILKLFGLDRKRRKVVSYDSDRPLSKRARRRKRGKHE